MANTDKTSKKAKKTVTAEVEGHIRVKGQVDRMFLILVCLLVAIGTLMVFSASYAYAKQNYGDSFKFARSQIMWVCIGTAGMILAMNFDYLIIRRYQLFFFIGSMILLLAVFTPLGVSHLGARRWINLGFTEFQPTELVKLAIILFFADHIARNRCADMTPLAQSFPYVGVGAFLLVILYFQPHISCLVIICVILFMLMVFGGVDKRVIGLIVLIGVIGLAGIMLIKSHSSTRIEVWLHPEEYTQSGGWQPLQSLYAIGSGGFWGVGLGQSTQKHLYLPEPQNDYIFAILCEELGFIGAAAVIILFLLLFWRGIYIAKHSVNVYTSLVVIGIITHLAVQTILNILVVTNTIPSTGIALPFFSYGGTSLAVIMTEMGMILNISRFQYLKSAERTE